MARITPEYIRRAFLAQFAHMSEERREGTIEALTVLHEHGLAAAHAEEEQLPLIDEATE